MQLRWGACWLVSACVTSHSQVCSDGSVCPVDTLCTPERHLCVLREQIDSCKSHAVDEACQYGALTGFCIDGACVPQVCSDGIIEPGEACDDSNNLPADGCSPDCLSLWSRITGYMPEL